jgi:16S rRNA (cytosine967-C5)-methyltransferase
MQCSNVEVQVYDGCNTDESLVGKADVVLLDVPCSGLGIMGKKRDIKYNVTAESIAELNVLQKEIVRASSKYVKDGGTLMYSTCTIQTAENEEMVRFISEELGFEPVSLADVLPEAVWLAKKEVKEAMAAAGKDAKCGLTEEQLNACIQFLPGYMESDGFFLAKFRKV